jgi:predicted dehydrogenase
MTPLGVGIVGAGTVGAMRAKTVRRHTAVRLVAVADVDANRARAVAGTDARAVTDHRDVVANSDVKLCIIASPVHCHEDAAIAAIDAGKHVLVEKPLSNSVASCRRIVDAAERAGVVLAVGFNHRYYPSFQYLRRLMDEGALGTIDHVRAFGGHEGMTQFRAPWMYERATLGGGAMMDVGIHVSDLVRSLGVEPHDVFARVTNGVWNVPGSEDNALVLARTSTGVPISYQATWSEWKGYRLRLEVYGHRGMALAFYPPLLNLVWTRSESGARQRRWKLYPSLNLREKFRGWQLTADDAFAAELDEVLRRLRNEPAACATGLDGLRAVQFADAAIRSSETGQVVEIES